MMEDIYENIQEKNRDTPGPRTWSQNRTKAPNSRSRWFVLITVCLGLICVVALILLYMHLTAERDQMRITYMNKVEKCNEALTSMKVNYSRLTEERDQLQNLNLELQTRVKNSSDAVIKSIIESCRYYTSSEKKSWTDSRQFCRDRGGDLVIINTEEEQRYISSLVGDRVWIGLSDIENEGVMKWVDNSPLNQRFWDEGEPNDEKGIEDCVEIWGPKPFRNNWNDLPCSEMRKWICEN